VWSNGDRGPRRGESELQLDKAGDRSHHTERAGADDARPSVISASRAPEIEFALPREETPDQRETEMKR
jgi:hypothetical protein